MPWLGRAATLEGRARDERAAMIIQAAFRGHVARRRYTRTELATRVVQKWVRKLLARKEYERLLKAKRREQTFDIIMRRHRERMQGMAQEFETIQAMNPVEFEGYRKRRIVAATKIQKMFRSWRARAQYLSNRHALALERPHGVDMRLYDPVWGRRAVEASRSHDDLGASAQALLARLRGPTGPDVAPPPQPHPAALDADAARPPAFPTDDAADDARRRALEQRIDDRVLSHRLASTVPLSSPSDMDSLDARLRRLTAERDASRGADEDLLRRRRVRLHLSRLTDALLGSAPGAPDSGGGGHGSWESLSEMPSALRAHHVPVPPEGSARMSRASQAHAMALAEITPVWWKPLARFQGLDVGAGDADTAALLGRLEAREAGRAERWEREWREVEAGWGVEELEAALRRSGVRAGG